MTAKIKILLLSLLFGFGMFPLSGKAAGAPVHAQKDKKAIQVELAHTQGPARIALLERLSSLEWNTPQQEVWLRQFYNESLRMDSFEAAGRALSGLSCYYHNNSMNNELVRCAKNSEFIARKLRYYPDSYFIVHAFDCLRDLWDGQYDKVIDKARHYYALSLKDGNKTGQIHFEELMGLIYQEMGKNKVAYPYMKKALDKQIKYYPSDYAKRTQLMTTLIEIALDLNDLPRSYSLLRSIEKLQNDINAGLFGNAEGFPFSRNRRLISGYFMNYYLRKKEFDKVELYKQRAESIKSSDVYVDFVINYQSALYYKAIKKYPEALSFIEKVIKADGTTTPEYILVRAEIYSLMGHMKEAAESYKLCYDKQKELDNTNFENKVSYLQQQQHVTQLQLSLKKSELHGKQLENRSLIITIVLLSLIILLACMYTLRNYRLRMLLAKDKERLLLSEKSLKLALEKAGEADRMKNVFLHTVSHEIRTPLNVIVGFSDYIVERYSDHPECAPYDKAIRENNELLLDMVDNLLDISRTLSSDIANDASSVGPCRVAEVCREAVNNIRKGYLLHPEVELSFHGEPEELVLITDRRNLLVILSNLLENAAKYTSKGNITVEYSINKEEGMVKFSVTDTGAGIAPEKQDAIFDFFAKGDDMNQGMGLGLSVCRLMVNKCGGSIYLDKDYTSGARFVFTHPLPPAAKS
jgi:signal transduction histidine kinase